jgi:hypothetical protein
MSSIIAIIGGIYALCILLSDISASQKTFLSKLDLVLQGQNEIKQELITNSDDHKKFALREPTIDFIIKHFNLK